MSFEPVYTDIGVYMVRVPLLPVDTGKELLASLQLMQHDPAIKITEMELWRSENWRLVLEAIRVGSPSLYDGVRKLDDPKLRPKKRLRILHSLARYIARMSHRPTPYGLFAGVASGAIRTKSLSVVGETQGWSKHAVLDWSWVLRIIDFIEADELISSHLEYRFNPLSWSIGDRLYCLANDINEVSIKRTTVIKKVMELTARSIPFSNIRASLHQYWPTIPQDVVESTLNLLRRRGFLVSELRPALTGNVDPIEHLLQRIPSEGKSSDTIRHTLETLLQLIHSYRKTPLGGGFEILDQIEQLVEYFESPPGDPPILHVDLRVGMKESQLSEEVTLLASDAVKLLCRLRRPLDGLPHLNAYRRAFLERYGSGCEVPLWQLLDTRSGLGPPPSYMHPTPSRYWDWMPPSFAARDEKLLSLAQAASRDCSLSVSLTESDVEYLSFDPEWRMKIPTSCDVFFSLVNKSSGHQQLVLSSNVGNSKAGKAFGRFLSAYPSDFDAVLRYSSKAVREDERDERVDAEMVVWPSTRVHGNVARIPHKHARELVGNATANAPDNMVISLKDILVGVSEDDRFYLRREPTGALVDVVTSHRYNHSNSHNFFRFLSEIGQEDTFLPQFDWGAARALPFLPRLEVGSIVLCVARWNLNPEVLKFERGIESFMSKWGVPRSVYQTSSDNRLLLNLEDKASIEYLRRKLLNEGSVQLEEVYPDPSMMVVDDSECRKYVGEFVLPLFSVDAEESRPVPVLISNLTGRKGDYLPSRTLIPGENCLYVRIHCDGSVQNEVLFRVEQILSGLQDTGVVDRWFFIRYRDPRPHIRLRAFGDPEVLWGQVLPEIGRMCRSLFDQGVITDVGLDTYHREVERYGGFSLVELAEDLFSLDTRFVLSLLRDPSFHSDSDTVRSRAITYSALTFLHSICGEAAEIWSRLDTLSGSADDRLVEFRHHYVLLRGEILRWFDRTFSGEKTIDPDSVLEDISAISRISKERENSIHALMASSEAMTETGRLPVRVVRSLLHMHINRLVGINQQEEVRTMYLLGRGYMEYSYRKANQGRQQL